MKIKFLKDRGWSALHQSGDSQMNNDVSKTTRDDAGKTRNPETE